MELTVLGHVLFPKNPEKIDIRLLHFREQIEQGHTFVPALLADTFRTLCIAKATLSTHLECCVSLLQVWFLEHLFACKPLTTKGLFQEDLIRAHLKRIIWDLFESREEWDSYLEKLRPDQLCWKPSWLHIGEAIIYGADKNPLLLLGFRGVERYSPGRVTRQFGWTEELPTINECRIDSFEADSANQRRAIQSWLHRRKVREPTMSQASEYDLTAQGRPTKKQTHHQLDSENSLTHENECLRREIKTQRALIEELKEEAQKKAQEHVAASRE